MTVVHPVTVTVDPTVVSTRDEKISTAVRVLLATGKFTAEAAAETADALQAERGTRAFDRALDSLHARGLISRSGWSFRDHA